MAGVPAPMIQIARVGHKRRSTAVIYAMMVPAL
jgi:hypothetical protein